MEPNQMNIYQRMAAVTAERETVPKSISVGAGKSSYKAVSEADVLTAIKPLEAKYGIYSYPFSREIVDSSTVTTQGNYGERINYRVRVMVTYRFINLDKPDEAVDIISFGDGIDQGDKAPGKAMTYADKYALLKAYKCVTGVDADNDASPYVKAHAQGTQPPRCEKCGHTIEGYTDSKGGQHGPQEVINAARKKFNRSLCIDCYRASN